VTIILSLINEDQAILVSDQKLSGSAPGTEWTKSTFVTTSDGRFGLGLAGLATVGSFDISQWILETLIRCGPPDFTSLGIIGRFATAATDFFAQRSAIRRVSPELRRLTLMFSGYLDGHSPPLAASAFVTNFQDWKTGTDSDTAWAKFDTRFENERRPNHGGPFSYIQRIGAWPAVNDADVAQLREMLEVRRPSRAIVECAVGIVRRMADRPEARNTIGKHAMSLIIPRDRRQHPTSEYHSLGASASSFMPHAVSVTGVGPSVAYWGVEVTARDPTTGEQVAAQFPRPRRNDRCVCGSGLKYKACCGK
jgi:SEC-C motif